MTDTSPAPAPAPRPERALAIPPLVLAGVFSAPGPALGVGRWLLVAVAAAATWAAAKALARATAAPAGCPGWLRHLAAGAVLARAPLAGHAAAHPDLAHPWGAVWLAAFALAWGAGLDVIHSARVGAPIAADTGTSAEPPARPRALDLSGWLLRAAEVCLIPAIARVMESVGQPLPSLAAAAAFGIWLGLVGLLHVEQKRAEESRPAAPGVALAVSTAVLVLVLVVRALSRGGL